MQTDYEYDLFISYAEADGAWVEGYLINALTQAGVRVHSETAFRLGAPRLLEFERAIENSKRTLLVLSPDYLADGFAQFTDLLGQSYGLRTATWPVIPLTSKPVKLPLRLAALEGLDATDPDRWPEVIERLCAALKRPVPGPAPKLPCPYPGMVPFRAKDARFFYGRGDEVEALWQRLRHGRYLFLIGPSGSGKSSLVSAGLLPILRERQPDYWQVREMRPGEDPLVSLARTLAVDGAPEAVNWGVKVEDLLRVQRPPAQRLLVLIDQFEELFTQTDKVHRSGFYAALLALRAVPACTLLLAMRADFYPDLMDSDLWPVDAAERLEIASLRGENLRDAIQRPAAEVGVYLEAGLLERLLADAAEEPGVLPLVQETMALLWERMVRRLLPVSAYERLGEDGRSGLAVAIAEKADATLAGLSPEGRTIARRIFLRLVQFGEGRADTRRQQPVADLHAVGDAPDVFDHTLRHLADNRLVTLSGEEGDPNRRADLAHEALIEGWPRFQCWLAERREAEQTRRRLEVAAANWVQLERKGGLLDEVELIDAERWLTSTDATELGFSSTLSEFVQASKQARRRRSLSQIATVSVILSLLSILVITGFIIWRNRSPWNQIFADDQVWALAATDETPPTYYLGTKDSGLRRSTDGVTWTTLQEGLPIGLGEPGRNIPAIERIAVDGQDPKRLFAFVSRHGVYRSLDGGDSWELAGTGVLTTSDIIVLAAREDLVLAVSDAVDGRGLYASQNGGQEWQRVGGNGDLLFDNVYAVHIDSRGNYVYVGAETGLYRLATEEPVTNTSAWQEIGDLPPVIRIVSGGGSDETFYLAAIDPEGIGSIYRWRPGESKAEWLTDVAEQPSVLVPHPTQTGPVLAYILFQNNQVSALQRTGELVSLGREPGLSLALLAVSHPREDRLWLLLGHEEGLYEYIGNLE